MKSNSIYLFLVICLFSVSVSGSTIVDFENFESYTMTSYDLGYHALSDELDTDGVAEAQTGLFGVTSGGYRSAQFLISEINESFYANEMHVHIDALTGSPQTQNFHYNVTVCETIKTSLSGDFYYGDCIPNTLSVLNSNFSMSERWGTALMQQYITFNGLYYFDSAKNYIIDIKYLSGGTLASSNYYSIEADDNGATLNHTILFRNQTADSLNARLPDFGLNTADFDIDNMRAESNNKWSCITNYPSCKQSVGLGNGNAYYELKTLAGNNYLNIYSVNGTALGHKKVRLRWNPDNVKPANQGDSFGTSKYTVQVRMKLNGNTVSLLAGSALDDGYAGVFVENFNYDGTSFPVLYTGAIITTNVTLHTRLRGELTGTQTNPLASPCFINDGDWHYVNSIYTFNATNPYNLNSVNVYVDGVFCLNYQGSFSSGLPTSLIPIETLNIQSSASYDMDIDDITIYEGSQSQPIQVELEDIVLDCPIDNCIQYDDFNDNDVSDWDDLTDTAILDSGILYFDSTEDFKYITDSFVNHDYDIIVGITEFSFNDSITPTEIDIDTAGGFIAYGIYTNCADDRTAYLYNVFITRDDDYTGSENRSVVNVYTYQDGDARQLGTLVVDNGDTLIIKNSFDYQNQRVGLNFLTDKDVTAGFNPDITFTQDFLQQCSLMGGVTIERRDSTQVDGFVGIDRIYYYGQVTQTGDDDFIFEHQNETLRNESLIKTDLDEDLHNMANTLGFRSVGMQILFWILLSGALIMMFVSEFEDKQAKTIIIFFGVVLMVAVGWYIKFIPTILFMFIIFVIAVFGALAIQRLLSSSN